MKKFKHLFLILFASLIGILGQTTDQPNKVITLSIYYSTASPGSRSFISKQLVPIYKILNRYLKLDFVPAGITSEQNQDGNSTIVCSRGPLDCLGNQIQGCALQYLKSDDLKLKFVDCFMKLYKNYTAILTCSQEVNLDLNETVKCVNETGPQILLKYAKRTDKEIPDIKELKYMPRLKFDGIQVSSPGKNFFSILCIILGDVPECKNDSLKNDKHQITFEKQSDNIVQKFIINADNEQDLRQEILKIITKLNSTDKSQKRKIQVENLGIKPFKITFDNVDDTIEALRNIIIKINKDKQTEFVPETTTSNDDQEFTLIVEDGADIPAQIRNIMKNKGIAVDVAEIPLEVKNTTDHALSEINQSSDENIVRFYSENVTETTTNANEEVVIGSKGVSAEHTPDESSSGSYKIDGYISENHENGERDHSNSFFINDEIAYNNVTENNTNVYYNNTDVNNNKTEHAGSTETISDIEENNKLFIDHVFKNMKSVMAPQDLSKSIWRLVRNSEEIQ